MSREDARAALVEALVSSRSILARNFSAAEGSSTPAHEEELRELLINGRLGRVRREIALTRRVLGDLSDSLLALDGFVHDGKLLEFDPDDPDHKSADGKFIDGFAGGQHFENKRLVKKAKHEQQMTDIM